MRTTIRLTIATIFLAATLACAKKRVLLPPPEEASSHGKVGYEFIAEPSAGKPRLSDNQEFTTPLPQRALESPEYPPGPLAADAPPYIVVVRIVIDTEGGVSSVGNSPLMASTPGPFAQDFRAAVEAAVRRWSFRPGYIDQLEDGDDVDDDGKADSVRIVRRDLVSVFYDVRFDFEIIAGQGRVTSTPPREPGPSP